MSDSQPDPAVVAATVNKFRELGEQWAAAQEQIDQAEQTVASWKAWQEQIGQQAQQCYSTATLFGFDLNEAYNAAAATNFAQAVAIPVDPVTPKFNMTVREFIRKEAENAFPSPVRASALRRKLKETYGLEVHEKTIGMTLYRMSQQDPPLMRREGRQDWFFVPDPDTAEGRAVSGRLI